MADYPVPERIIRFEAPPSFFDGQLFRREVAPHMFSITGITGGGDGPLDQLLDELARDMGVPRVERGAGLLIAFDDGEDSRVSKMIGEARRRRLPYTVVMFEGEGA